MSALAPELLLAALVVTSLATGGLLGLWAATSPRHWFVRTLVVFAVLTPLLYRPIYEPFVTLLVEVGVVVLGVTVWRRNWPSWKFSIADILMLTVPVAILVASAMRAPETEWLRPVGLGVVGGVITIFAAWLAASSWTNRKRLGVFALCLPFLSFGWYWANYVDDFLSWFDLYGTPVTEFNIPEITYGSLWAAFLIVMQLLATMIALPFAWDEAAAQIVPGWRRPLSLVIGIAIALYPAYLAVLLSFPVPLPAGVPTGSLAYVEMISLADAPAFERAESVDSGTSINWKAMAKAVHGAKNDYERTFVLVQEPLTIPVAYDLMMPNLDDSMARRSIARIWAYRAEVARLENDAEAALTACEFLLKYAEQLEGQGLLVDGLISSAVESSGLDETYKAAALLSAEQSKKLVAKLDNHNENRCSLEPMWYRERAFSENTSGWLGHFMHWLDYWAAVPIEMDREEMTWALRKRNATLSTLLAAQLALRAHQLENNAYPKTLADLVPNYLPHVPADPCSDSGEPIIYRRSADGYQLYSHGYDGDDDGGKPCTTANEWGTIDWTTDGDLSLEAYFAEE